MTPSHQRAFPGPQVPVAAAALKDLAQVRMNSEVIMGPAQVVGMEQRVRRLLSRTFLW
uniref:Uncharacterized protein n=1 Tax=Canis lupus familiaris TaxID=9615 RepID=A0A8C0M4C1_CANLF